MFSIFFRTGKRIEESKSGTPVFQTDEGRYLAASKWHFPLTDWFRKQIKKIHWKKRIIIWSSHRSRNMIDAKNEMKRTKKYTHKFTQAIGEPKFLLTHPHTLSNIYMLLHPPTQHHTYPNTLSFRWSIDQRTDWSSKYSSTITGTVSCQLFAQHCRQQENSNSFVFQLHPPIKIKQW